jgi:hypothetical protein
VDEDATRAPIIAGSSRETKKIADKVGALMMDVFVYG